MAYFSLAYTCQSRVSGAALAINPLTVEETVR